eukprot:637698-Prorocentrum_minimum.AAC.1
MAAAQGGHTAGNDGADLTRDANRNTDRTIVSKIRDGDVKWPSDDFRPSRGSRCRTPQPEGPSEYWYTNWYTNGYTNWYTGILTGAKGERCGRKWGTGHR